MPRLLVLSTCCAAALLAAGAPAGTARGTVYHDRNQNARRDADEHGLPGIRVSNGREIVMTDRDGRYQLPGDDDTILFVIKPSGWMTPVDPRVNLPRFYYIHKPGGSPQLKYPGVDPTGPLPKSVDFPLVKRHEPQEFRVLIFGDTQPRNMKEVEYIAHDVVEELIGMEGAFGLSLGDLVFDRLELFDPLNEVVAKIGFAFYNILGNHDIDFTAPSDELSDETFERTYGPPYYSFDYANVHFVVLDNIMWHPADEAGRKAYYDAQLGEDQLAFLRNDLALVPKDMLVVLTMHIPIMEIRERNEIYALLAKFPHNVSFSGHWHIHRQWFLDRDDGWPGDEPHHHTTFVTACGSWWTGAPDELGIPHTTMRDGAPNGWAIATFDDSNYAVEFRAARRPATYQMNIWAPEAVAQADAAETAVLANIFAGSERSQVEMRLNDGRWVPMTHTEREDPYYVAMKQAEESDNPPRGRNLPKVVPSSHIWVAKLPANPPKGTHIIEVRTADMYGKIHYGRRIIRIE